MYQNTAAMQMNVKFHQQELIHEAESDRMARAAHAKDGHSPFEHKLAAVAVALVTVLGVIALI